jgi:hypothetical protein
MYATIILGIYVNEKIYFFVVSGLARIATAIQTGDQARDVTGKGVTDR